MDKQTTSRLLELNRQFYENFAQQFSATRQRIQPGVQHVLTKYLENTSAEKRILDLGCGNGELARRLAKQGFEGKYIGLDFSVGLLQEATYDFPPSITVRFFQADLSDDDWQIGVVGAELKNEMPFDFILAFAVLHHLPGRELQHRVIKTIYDLLSPQGLFILSVWQFLQSPRLKERIQPWQEIGLTSKDVDSGDYLLDWRSGGKGLRYVHHFSETELEEFATGTGFALVNTFHSDGQGGRLGLYQVWKKM
jgi:tRNA (uracil-5-)-methyltransferase TRM9